MDAAKTWRKLTLLILVLASLNLKANTAEATPSPAEPIIYIVAPNDTLSAIAQRYHTTVTVIVKLNDLTNPDLIFVGQRLQIPIPEEIAPAPTTVYTVQRGDTLYAIASRYGTTVPAIAAANGLTNPDLIYPGQRLIIPGMESSPIAVLLEPTEVLQSQTLVIKIPLNEAMTVKGSFDGRTLTFAKDKSHHWALVGIDAWSNVGPHSLELVVTKPEGIIERISRMVTVLKATFPTNRIDLPPEASELLDPALVSQERERLNLVMKDSSERKLWEGLFVVPTEGQISLPFGRGVSYNGGPVTSYHTGVDFAAPEGSLVLAANNGRVVLAEELTVRGGTVFLDHGLGVFSGYFHLSEILVEEGQEIAKGKLIGKVGNTGLSSGPHLHWGIRVGGVYVSPLEWTWRLMP